MRFVSVTLIGALVVPTDWLANPTELGLIVIVANAGVPVVNSSATESVKIDTIPLGRRIARIGSPRMFAFGVRWVGGAARGLIGEGVRCGQKTMTSQRKDRLARGLNLVQWCNGLTQPQRPDRYRFEVPR